MTLSEFVVITGPLYRQFSLGRMPDEWKAKHVQDRFAVLSRFTPATLTLAVTALLASETRMPTIASMRQACIDSIRAGQAKRPAPPEHTDSNTCPCGCGGTRWAKPLPASQEFPDIPRFREFVHCKRQGIHPPTPDACDPPTPPTLEAP